MTPAHQDVVVPIQLTWGRCQICLGGGRSSPQGYVAQYPVTPPMPAWVLSKAVGETAAGALECSPAPALVFLKMHLSITKSSLVLSTFHSKVCQ